MKEDRSTSHVVLAKGALIFLAGRALGRLLALVFQAVLARLLLPYAFGLFALGWTVFRLVEAIGPLGLQSGVLRFASATAAADPTSARPTVRTATRFALMSGGLLGVAGVLLAPFLAVHVFHKPAAAGIFRWFALGFPFLTALVVAAGATQALQTTRYVATVREFGQPLLVALLATTLVLAGFGVNGAAAGVVAATALSAALAVGMADRLFPRGPGSVTGVSSRALLAVSIPAAAASAFRLLLGWTDRLVVGAYLPAADLGGYHAAAQLAAVLPMVAGSFAGILAATVVAAVAANDYQQARKLHVTSVKWMLYLATPALVPLIVAPASVLGAVFGSSYVYTAPVLRVLAIGQSVSLLAGAVGALLVMTDRQMQWMKVAGICFGTNLVLTLWLTPRFGLIGAAASTSIALAELVILGVWQTSRALHGWSMDVNVGKATLVVGFALAAGFAAAPYLPFAAGLRTLALSVLAVFTAVAGLAMTGLDEEEKLLYAALVSHIKKRDGQRPSGSSGKSGK